MLSSTQHSKNRASSGKARFPPFEIMYCGKTKDGDLIFEIQNK